MEGFRNVWRGPFDDFGARRGEDSGGIPHGSANCWGRAHDAVVGIVADAQSTHIDVAMIAEWHRRLYIRVSPAIDNFQSQRHVVDVARDHADFAGDRSLSVRNAVSTMVRTAPGGRLEAGNAAEVSRIATAAPDVGAEPEGRSA